MQMVDYLMAGTVSLMAGLDRTAALQVMIARPIVAAPLVGWLLGDPFIGLQIGALLELLWLGRLPVGAAIPPDDTQVAIGATVLTLTMGNLLPVDMPLVILCVLTAIPLGKVGQWFDRLVRHGNGRLLKRAERAIEAEDYRQMERTHLFGLAGFALASLGTFITITLIGSLFLYYFAPLFLDAIQGVGLGLKLTFTLVGAAVFLGTVNVSRAATLFCASFTGAMLMLWLL